VLRLLLALALVTAPPSAALTSKAPATVGQTWRSTLVVRGAAPSAVTLTATSSAGRVSVRAPRVARGRYAVRIVFPSAGRWTLTTRLAGRRLALGVVQATDPELLLERPAALLAEPDGTLLLAEGGRQRVLRVDPASGRVTVVAQGFENPFGLGRLPDGDLVVSSEGSVFRLDETGRREAIATFPSGVECGPIAIDAQGLVYVAATDHRIHRVDPSTRAVEAVAGNGGVGDTGDGGPALAATMSVPHGLLFQPDGSLLIADTDNDTIRRFDLGAGVITTFARDVRGVAMLARTADGAVLASELRSDRVLRIAADGSRTVAARVSGNPWSLAVAADGTPYVVDSGSQTLNRIAADGTVTRVRLIPPT
jgi:sugar lactone lactonase YvrE